MSLLRDVTPYTHPDDPAAPWDVIDGQQYRMPVADRSGTKHLVPGVYLVPSAAGMYPTIFWCRGGFDGAATLDDLHIQELADWCNNEEDLHTFVHGAPIGYVAMACDYFGGASTWSGRPAGWTAVGQDELGGDELRTVLAMPGALQTVTKANTARSALVGSSRGGMMAGLALMRGFPARALVLLNPLLDISHEHYRDHADIDTLLRANVDGFDQAPGAHLAQRDVLAQANRLPVEVPVLIVQGMRDTVVRPEAAEELAWRINRRGGRALFVPIEDADHNFQGSGDPVEDYGTERRVIVQRFLADELGVPAVTTDATSVP